MAKRAELTESEIKTLRKALESDAVEGVRGFLNRGLDPNAKLEDDYAQFSPLHMAALRGAAGVVRLLLDAGAKVNAKVAGGTPLMDACLGCGTLPKKDEVVKLLLAAGADPNAKSGSDEGDSGLTALMHAAEDAGLEVIKLLLAAGADPKILTRKGRSAINLALERMYDRPESQTMAVIRTLVEAGCPAAGACLACPVGEGNIEIVRYLISAGADVNAATDKLDQFRNSGPGASMVSLALQGVINSEMDKGWPAYDPQARGRYVQVLKELVRAGASLAPRAGGLPPLTMAAAYGGDLEAVKLLLELGADPKACSDWRMATALHAAAAYGHLEIARALIDAGADVNILSPENRTPLDEAILNNRTELADLLRSAGGRQGSA